MKKNDFIIKSVIDVFHCFSIILSILVLIFNKQLLGLLFGKVESDVMKACVTYLRISAYSYPALAIYNAGAALYRSMAKTKVTMYISFAANIINVVGNIIGVYVLKAGVAGVAYPSLISRVFSAIIITVLCFNKNWKLTMIQKISLNLMERCSNVF